MKKYNVMGHEMVKLEDLCYVLREARKKIDHTIAKKSEEEKKGMREMWESIARHIFIEEIRKAKDKDEVDAILEIPGDFIVYGKAGKGRYNLAYFGGYDKGEAVITPKASAAMHFAYEGMAEHVAEKLGEGWIVFDTCQAAQDDTNRLLSAIFDDNDDEDPEEGDE